MISKILLKFEASNAKRLLRSKWAGIEVEETMKYLNSFGTLDAAKSREILEESQSIDDIVHHIAGLGYGASLKEALIDKK